MRFCPVVVAFLGVESGGLTAFRFPALFEVRWLAPWTVRSRGLDEGVGSRNSLSLKRRILSG